MPCVNWRSIVSASRPWSVWKRVLIPNRCSAKSPAAHICGMERNDFSRLFASYWRGRGYQIQLALAGTVGAAWALAHTATISLVPAGDEEAALSGLPVAALRLPPDALERLEALGLRTIGDVLRLPRETLASRFGVILPQRLDQALGLLPETFVCERLQRAACGRPRVGSAD